MLIGRDEFDVSAHGLRHKAMHRSHIGTLDHLANQIALAGNRTDDRSLTPPTGLMMLLVGVAVSVKAADVGFVHFDDPHQLPEFRIVHRSPQPMAHREGGLVGSGFDCPVNLQGADPLLASEHQKQHPKPSAERVLRVFENSSRDEREAVGVSAGAFGVPALPLPRLSDFVNVLALVAARALYAIRLAMREQIVFAGFVIGEHPLELRPRHLHRELWLMIFAFSLNIGETHARVIKRRCKKQEWG